MEIKNPITILNRAIKHILLLAGMLVLFVGTSVDTVAQQYEQRTIADNQVQDITNQERWRYGRKPDWGNVKRRGRGLAGRGNGLPGRGGGGGGAVTTGGGNGGNNVTYYDNGSNGDGTYYYSDGNNGNNNTGGYSDYNNNNSNGGNNNPVVDPPPVNNNTGSTFSPPPTPNLPDAPDVDGEGLSNFLIWVLIALAVGLVGWLVYKNFSKDAIKGKKKKAKEESEYVDFEDEEAEFDIHEVEFVDDITLAVRAGNYRKAVRLRFLNALKGLAEKSLIYWKINKTNIDYYYELAGQKELRPAFMDVTTVYDYVWYGEFKIGEEEYRQVDETFNKFNEQLARA